VNHRQSAAPHKIILSAGMPRAGSGWYYNLTQDLWLAAGGQDAHIIRKRYHLERVLTERNCNIGRLTPKSTLAVLVPYFLGNSFVVKIHFAPTAFGQWVFRRSWMAPTFVYRDPRDAALSVYEYGMRKQVTKRDNAFSQFDTIEKAINFISGYMRDWETWVNVPGILLTRYEDMLMDYDGQCSRLLSYLGFDAADPRIGRVLEQFRPGERAGMDSGMHFNKGISGRFRSVFSPSQLELCAAEFIPWLERMGYEP
jgi:hypothetical protein